MCEIEDKNEYCIKCKDNDTCWKDVFTECLYEEECGRLEHD
ncbi:hypothetical protein P5E39_12675 [Clostridium perfringens]|nr:hypothetical protein [Clostridium perfringens]